MFGDEDHQEVAREALPLLIEKAKARETINYSDLAHKIEISAFEYPMPQMLSSIVTTLYELGQEWEEDIPYITALVVKASTGYPSFPPNTSNEVFDMEFERIYGYRKWDAVLRTLLPEANPVYPVDSVPVSPPPEEKSAILTKSLRMWRRLALAFAVAFIISFGVLLWPKDVERVVYITQTGRKYHTYDCPFLVEHNVKDKFAIYLGEAEKDYDPCGICNSDKGIE